jgi:hypothetical protein
MNEGTRRLARPRLAEATMATITAERVVWSIDSQDRHPTRFVDNYGALAILDLLERHLQELTPQPDGSRAVDVPQWGPVIPGVLVERSDVGS